jgi:hypothetical protein
MSSPKRDRLVWTIASIVSSFLRAIVIAWALDALRPQIPWLPHLTWWGVWLALLILGSTVGDVTEGVLYNITRWIDAHGSERAS